MSEKALIAIEVFMKEAANPRYDSGEDGIFAECRSCRFHRPYAKDHTFVFRTCPYSAQPTSTRKPTRWILAYVNPIPYNGGDYPERQHHRSIQSERRCRQDHNDGHLGIGLANAGEKVLLVDCDPQASLTISLGYPQPDKLPCTLSTLMGSVITDDPFIPVEAILHHAEGVDLLPASIELSGISREGVDAIREAVKELERAGYVMIGICWKSTICDSLVFMICFMQAPVHWLPIGYRWLRFSSGWGTAPFASQQICIHIWLTR